MPVLSAPVVGTVSLIHDGQPDGLLVAALGLGSLFLSLIGWYRGLWLTGPTSLLVVGLSFFAYRSRIAEMKAEMNGSLDGNMFRGLADLAMASVQLQWGWLLLFGGATMLIASAATAPTFHQRA
ncbi:MAG: hypothetical protein AAF211_01360 [Myxococcota bacterium]